MKNNETGEESSDEFDTVMMAIGREPCTRGIGFDNVNVELAKNGKVIVNDKEETNVENIYAIGDILLNRLELTPVAIQVDDGTFRFFFNLRFFRLVDILPVAFMVEVMN